ncbi:MAG: SDR family oxidoreductase [Pseudobacteriovorax sp.]|nr:SDR family oxidoreductase [Pseudobacteriovorax sp.]
MTSQKITVIGASGGSGRKAVEALLERGHQVTAVSRSASKVFSEKVRTVDGSALDKSVLKKAIEGQDAVIVTLGISENPIRVRAFGPTNTPINIRSEGTRKVIEVMKELGVKRLLVQTTFGSGPSKHDLGTMDSLFFSLLLKPQILDTEKQDQYVRASGLDWTITQPVHLKDDDYKEGNIIADFNSGVERMGISRKLVSQYTVDALTDPKTIGKTVALSTSNI